MSWLTKIKTKDELKAIVLAAQAGGQTVVQCHGCFDILHPGHLRHLARAREQGDVLVVTVTADNVVSKGAGRPYVPQDLRAENLAAIEVVNYVAIDDGDWAGPVLEFLRPNVYVKGKEFEDVHDGRFGRERKLVEGYGGRMFFSSGDVVYSSSFIIDNLMEKLDPTIEQIRQFAKRHEITRQRIETILDQAATKRLLVIGEVIADRYIFTDPIGMSSDAPTIVVRPRETQDFAGGAAIVARHCKAICGATRLISVVGLDDPGAFVRNELARDEVDAVLVPDRSRPTILKTRFIGGGRKLLNVNEFRDHNLDEEVEREVLKAMEAARTEFDAVIVSDFSYGTITPRIVDTVRAWHTEHGMPVIGDVQCSTQLGNVARLKGITISTPSEREARLSLCDRESGIADVGVRLLEATRNRAMLVTLGARGMMILDTADRAWEDIVAAGTHLHQIKRNLAIEYLPSFSRMPVDPMGAGDALLATLATCFAAGATVLEASFIGNCASAVAVGTMGNVPVQRDKVLETVHQILP